VGFEVTSPILRLKLFAREEQCKRPSLRELNDVSKSCNECPGPLTRTTLAQQRLTRFHLKCFKRQPVAGRPWFGALRERSIRDLERCATQSSAHQGGHLNFVTLTREITHKKVCDASKLSQVVSPPSSYPNAIAAAKNLVCKVARALVSQTSKKEPVYVAKACAVLSVDRSCQGTSLRWLGPKSCFQQAALIIELDAASVPCVHWVRFTLVIDGGR
jgi:hypothetical protein